MGKTAKITSKGQITIPREVRRAMSVKPGDRIVFERRGSRFSVTAVRSESPFERFRGIGNPGIGGSREAIVRWLRDLRGE